LIDDEIFEYEKTSIDSDLIDDEDGSFEDEENEL
jgi:hypothetical protein